MKKYLLIALLMVSQIGQAMDGHHRRAKGSESTDSFNPESSNFSQMKTLRTWVADKHQKDEEFMKELRRNVAMEVPENGFSHRLCLRPIANNPGDDRYFGKSFPAIHSIQLPFLQYVHDISKTKDPIVAEMAASNGLVSWKIPLALHNSGQVYVNELSATMLKEFELFKENRLNKKQELKKVLHTIQGDCFDILRTHPHLEGKIDVLYVQNLLHFFNPIQYQAFLKLLGTLLSENGRAYIVAHTINSDDAVHGNPIFDFYLKQKQAGDMYPGFHQVIGSCEILTDSHAVVGGKRITSVVRPTDATPTGRRILSQSQPVVMMTSWGPKAVGTTTQEVTDQFFTPTIYKESIKLHPSLEVLDSFFIDEKGDKYGKFSESKDISFAAVILTKKPNPVSSASVSLAINDIEPLVEATNDLTIKDSSSDPVKQQSAQQS